MHEFTITVDQQFRLDASASFAMGFPGTTIDESGGSMAFAWAVDGEWTTVGVHLRQIGRTVHGEIVGSVSGDLADLVRRDVERILCADVDGSGFAGTASNDPVVASMHARFPGLRPVLFYTPYEAAAWCIIGHRIRMSQAAGIKQRLGDKLGVLGAFPAPARLEQLESGFKGLTDPKTEQLRQLGSAASSGLLSRDHLRAQSYDDAIAELQELAGIGPFSAELIMIRGVGVPDALPRHEKRMTAAIRQFYDTDDVAGVAEQWRPYRSWVGLLLRAAASE
ncbi:DNA-3-methyladenine glycosylase family protein [Rhodococcus sp. 077-4]|uniref:DNA-3-methyladenine glycosylase family protein n=1 Tax=Rhodococcus sp. 077-4 TaxID=2789271 RepID=UPI0039F53D85